MACDGASRYSNRRHCHCIMNRQVTDRLIRYMSQHQALRLFACIGLWSLIWLSISSATGAQETAIESPTTSPTENSDSVWKQLGLPEPNPNAPYAKPPQLELLFEDDFSNDVRGDYQIGGKQGAAKWEIDQLMLQEGGKAKRAIQAGSKVTLDLNWQIPEPNLGERLDFSITFVPVSTQQILTSSSLAAGNPTSVRIIRELGLDGIENLEIRTTAVGTTDVSRATIFCPSDGEQKHPLLSGCRIEYNHGHVLITTGDDRVQSFYSDMFPADIVAIEFECRSGEMALKQLRVHATPATPEFPIAEKLKLLGAATSDSASFTFRDQGRYADAKKASRKSVDICRRILGEYHFYTINATSNLASACFENANFQESEALIELNRRIAIELFGLSHPQTVDQAMELAKLYEALGRYSESVSLNELSLARYREQFESDHFRIAEALNALAEVYQASGRSGEAEPMYEESLSMFRRILVGDDHNLIARGLNNLGVVRWRLGRLLEAEPLLDEALAIRRRIFAGDHRTVAISLYNLASVRQSLGRVEEAEPLVVEALAMSRRLFPGDHQDVALGLNNLAGICLALDRYDEAHALFNESLGMRERLFPGDHSSKARIVYNRATEYARNGRYAEAAELFGEALDIYARAIPGDNPDVLMCMVNDGVTQFRLGMADKAAIRLYEALAMSERMRTQVRGELSERAAYSGAINLTETSKILSTVLVDLNQTAAAMSVLERGNSRAGLDLFAGGSQAAEMSFLATSNPESVERYRTAKWMAETARKSLIEAETKLGRVRPSQGTDLMAEVRLARATLTERSNAVQSELMGLVPQVNPLKAEEILSQLGEGEGFIAWAWVEYGPIVLIGRDNHISGFALTSSTTETSSLEAALSEFRKRVSTRPDGASPIPESLLRLVKDRILPPDAREKLMGLRTVIVIPDTIMKGLPLELLIDNIPLIYAHSATIAINRRNAARHRKSSFTKALVLGDPNFRGFSPSQSSVPSNGVLLTLVETGSIADVAGLVRGDVLLSYGETELHNPKDLALAIAAEAKSDANRKVSLEIWRDNKTKLIDVTTGKLGVQLSQANSSERTRTMELLDRLGDEFSAHVSAVEQVRLYGKSLTPLPGTRLEGMVVANLLGTDANLLLGADATAPKLNEAIESNPLRVLHLATHGLMGSSERPLLASLALTTPAEPTTGDTGFVTLEDIFSTWGARLKGTELVVLSACDTARGVQQGDTSMALPLGLFVCGAETVIASQWKVDDTATALLMSRFYANWLGKTDSERVIDGITYAPGQTLSKLAALREAQAWLRGLNSEQVATITVAMSGTDGAKAVTQFTRGGDDELAEASNSDFPFAHPYYWSAFVLYGSPE